MKQPNYAIQAGEFKAKCLHLMDEVSLKHISITITKRGKPIAKLVPIEEKPLDTFGCLKDAIHIQDDIVAPIDVKWEAMK